MVCIESTPRVVRHRTARSSSHPTQVTVSSTNQRNTQEKLYFLIFLATQPSPQQICISSKKGKKDNSQKKKKDSICKIQYTLDILHSSSGILTYQKCICETVNAHLSRQRPFDHNRDSEIRGSHHKATAPKVTAFHGHQ